jgi:uridine kinase
MVNELTLDKVVKTILDFCINNYKLIYISGNGGSGKTTLSKHLIDEMNSRGYKVNCIDMDEFVLDTKMRKSGKKKWLDLKNNIRESEYTTSFKESYYLAAPEVIVHSLMSNKDCFYKPKKSDEFIEIHHKYPLTIIEGVGTAFLNKNRFAFSVFLMCDQELETQRRIMRSRDGESNLSFEEVNRKSIERKEQFEVFILPEKSKFDLELWSLEDYSFKIERDDFDLFVQY